MNYKVLKFTTKTTTGSQGYTGVGFQPKAIIFLGTKQTAEQQENGMYPMVGMAVDSTHEAAINLQDENIGSGNSTGGRRHDGANSVVVIDSNNNLIVGADFTSMDADGFTLNYSTANGSAYNVYAICFGGSDLSVFLKQFTLGGSTGNFSVTGVGFQPDMTIFMSVGNTAAPAGAGSVLFGGLGAAKSSSNRYSFWIRDDNGQSTTKGESVQLANRILCTTSGSLGKTNEVDFVSHDSDGYTLNVVANAAARYVWGLSLRGINTALGVFNQSTSTGNQAITGTGFQPTGILLMSTNRVSSTSVVASARMSIGAASSSSNRANIWGGSKVGAVNRTNTAMLNSSDALLKMATADTANSVETVMDFVSMDSDGFTVNNTTTDATSREVIYMAFGTVVTTLSVTVSDSITLTESINETLVDNLSVSDSITITESIAYLLISFVTVSENITVTESITKLLISFILTSESVTLTENLGETLVHNSSVSEIIYTREPSKYALTFNGSSQYGTFTAPFTRTAGQPFTAVTWFKTSTVGVGAYVIVGVRSGSDAGDLWKIEVNNLKASFQYDPTGSGGILASTSNVNNGLEHCIVAVYTGTNLILYLDGIQVAISGTLASAAIDQTSGAIGRRRDTSEEYFPGDIGPTYIFTRALSATEAEDHWEGRPLDLTNLQTGWQMHEGSGAKLGDISSNNAAVTLVNSPTWTSGFGNSQQLPNMLSFVNVNESITVTENIGILLVSYINKSESVTITESIQKLMTSYINDIENITITESLSMFESGPTILLDMIYDNVDRWAWGIKHISFG